MSTLATKAYSTDHYAFLAGGGEMSEIILNTDWCATSLGEIETWPGSLRTTLGIVLHSAFPMFLFWGDDLISLSCTEIG